MAGGTLFEIIALPALITMIVTCVDRIKGEDGRRKLTDERSDNNTDNSGEIYFDYTLKFALVFSFCGVCSYYFLIIIYL